MARLPVIVGFGGFNAAGRSSFHQSYQRMILDSLDASRRRETLNGLAVMMGCVKADGDSYTTESGERYSAQEVEAKFGDYIRDNTLVRPISEHYFDTENLLMRQRLSLAETEQRALQFDLLKRHLPDPLPEHWQITDIDSRYARINVDGNANLFLDSHYECPVKGAGQLPEGYDPARTYKSRFHPRGLQMAIVGASDAINSIGVDWQTILQHVSPDQIGAYSTSVMSQMDGHGNGGLLQSRLNGDRVSSKQLALGLGSMASDFVNAYVLGNLGNTGSIAGACASFLYNLRAGIEDIQAGRCRVAVVGSSEAPIVPEVIEGYANMSALATYEKLCNLDDADSSDLRRSSRPFGNNCGFVIAESTQHVVLMDDELALALGADIYGAVTDVFINGDGYKKSISAPGPGNYLTFGKAVGSIRSLLGDDAIRYRSFVQAHGSSTPQNRVTESEILDRVARAFGIEHWPLTAVKAYVGHSLGPASGDQLINTLGIFAQGILPGIKTIDKVADDVLQERLSISTGDRQLEQPMDVAFLNSKGFGGNNATAAVLSPTVTTQMLGKRYGEKAMAEYHQRLETTREQANHYHQQFLKGDYQVIYQYGKNMLADEDIALDSSKITVPGYGKAIDLTKENLYKDMV